MFWWVGFENDDAGPFASRELAEMVVALEGSGEVFTSSTQGFAPIMALTCGRYPSKQVAWTYETA